jgi:uncharacterized protein (DUF433 family)
MSLLDRIEPDPRVCNGKAVIQGTRIPVSVILDQVASGDSWDDIVKGFPELKKEDIQAALLYASCRQKRGERGSCLIPSGCLDHACGLKRPRH